VKLHSDRTEYLAALLYEHYGQSWDAVRASGTRDVQGVITIETPPEVLLKLAEYDEKYKKPNRISFSWKCTK
jgi:hypothetical protein